MIKGKAKMEFGSGDIRMTGALSNGVGALCCITQEPHEIGEKVPVEDEWDPVQAEVILTFSKADSIDALIAEEECKTQCGDLDKYEYTENCPDYSGTKVIE